MSDRGYFFLLSHLHRPTTSLPLSAIQTSIAHYLASLPQPPTSLAGSIISSPLFQPLSYAKLEIMCTALRHAVQLKVKLLQEERNSLFARSVQHRTGEWVKGVLEGFRGGHPTLKLVCCGGLLLGLEDVESELHAREGRMRREVEEEVILALAEVIDTYSYVRFPADWAKDFKSESQDGEEPLSLSLLISSRFVPLVSSRRLETLPLPILSDLLTSTIESAFQGGKFLRYTAASLSRNKDGTIHFEPTTPFAQTMQTLASSKFIASMASLSKSCAHVLSVLTESRPAQGWLAMAQTTSRLERIAESVEAGWMFSPFASTSEEKDIAPGSLEIMTQFWAILKTQLFTTLMLSQSILSAVVFVPHPAAALSTTPSSSLTPSPFSLAESVLRTLAHLSFVIHQFGGVTSTAQSSFPELKRVFYMALDVLSSSSPESERFVLELCKSARHDGASSEIFVQMKKAYVLACIEQLVPVLSDSYIRSDVFPSCLPHLYNTTHRETYESAHSVMLAIFASYAQKAGENVAETQPTPANKGLTAFAEEVVPYYAQCLIENTEEGKLNTVQLCMAYAALVRSASAFGRKKAVHCEDHTDGDVFAWYCIEKLLSALRQVDSTQPSVLSKGDQLHRLRLAVISTLPSVSLSLLPRLLEECKAMITSITPPTAENISDSEARPTRIELVRALFKEISENVGDAEKESCMRWWYENRDALAGVEDLQEHPNDSPVNGHLVSRL